MDYSKQITEKLRVFEELGFSKTQIELINACMGVIAAGAYNEGFTDGVNESKYTEKDMDNAYDKGVKDFITLIKTVD